MVALLLPLLGEMAELLGVTGLSSAGVLDKEAFFYNSFAVVTDCIILTFERALALYAVCCKDVGIFFLICWFAPGGS